MQVKVALGVFFEQVLTRADLNTVLGNRGRLPLELKPREASIAQWAALCCLMLSVCWLFHHLGRLFQVCEMQSNIAMYTLQALLEPLWWMTAYVQLHTSCVSVLPRSFLADCCAAEKVRGSEQGREVRRCLAPAGHT